MNTVVLSVAGILHILVSGVIRVKLVEILVVILRYRFSITVGLSFSVLGLVRFI